MQEFWTELQIERALNYNGPFMPIDPRGYADRREVPRYLTDEVALYLGIKRRTLRNWFFGYHYTVRGERRFADALVEPAAVNPYGPALSFYNLAEAQVLAATRQKWIVQPAARPAGQQPIEPSDDGARSVSVPPKFGDKRKRRGEVQISMQAIRSGIQYVSKEFPRHPLISQYFFTDGKSLFVKQVEDKLGEHLTVNVSRLGQLAFSSILEIYLQRIERDSSGPIKIYPLRQIDDMDKSIVITPGIASGRPVINGTGIRAETVWHRFSAGETVDELADDYDIEPRVIDKAISYFTNVRAA